jgi:hypothetical protein
MSDLGNNKMMSKDIFERLDGYCIHATSDNTGTVFTIEELYQAFKGRMERERPVTVLDSDGRIDRKASEEHNAKLITKPSKKFNDNYDDIIREVVNMLQILESWSDLTDDKGLTLSGMPCGFERFNELQNAYVGRVSKGIHEYLDFLRELNEG